MRKSSLRLSIAALAFAISAPTVAETLVFDPDGPGPDAPVQVQMWDFAPGNVLARDGVTAATNGPGSPFSSFGQSSLIALFMNGSAIALPRLNADYEITQVVRFGQKVEETVDLNSNAFSEAASFRFNSDPGDPNFFELWWSPKNSDALSGTGYNDSVRILKGRVVDSYSTFVVSEFSVPALGGTPQPFDRSADGNQYPGITSLAGSGTTNPLTIQVTEFDPAFFPGLQASNLLSFLIRVENFSQAIPFSSTNPSRKFTEFDGGAAPSVNPLIGALNGITGPDIQFQTDFNAVMQTISRSDQSCRMTGGGVTVNGEMPLDESGFPLLLTAQAGSSNSDRYEFGGQIGAPSAAQPQPFGEWTHHQQSGPDGSWVFHAGTHSAPDATMIKRVTCADPGYCQPARPAPFKQLNWEGVGQFKNLQKAPKAWKNVVSTDSLHWVRVHYEDLGEPGGPNGAQTKNANCNHTIGTIVGDPATSSTAAATCSGCPDVYQITIYKKGTDPASDPSNKALYAVGGYIDHGNIQLHPAIKP